MQKIRALSETQKRISRKRLIFRNERDKGWMIMGLEQSREHKE